MLLSKVKCTKTVKLCNDWTFSILTSLYNQFGSNYLVPFGKYGQLDFNWMMKGHEGGINLRSKHLAKEIW